jgi:hypothetical protein
MKAIWIVQLLSFYFSCSFLQGITTRGEEGLDSTKIRIEYKVREGGAWRTANSLLVDRSDPSEIGRVAKKYMRKQEPIRLFDTELNMGLVKPSPAFTKSSPTITKSKYINPIEVFEGCPCRDQHYTLDSRSRSILIKSLRHLYLS